jgi:PleD family two-component response regulator
MSDGEMMIGVGIWTVLSTDALVFRPVLPRHADSLLRSQSFGSPVTRTMWKAACFIKDEGGNTMARETILYISDQATSSDSVIAALETTGYEVLSTNSSTQAIAMLYIIIQLLPSCSITGRESKLALTWSEAYGRFTQEFRSSC